MGLGTHLLQDDHGGDVAQQPWGVVLQRLLVTVRAVAGPLLLVVIGQEHQLQDVLPVPPQATSRESDSHTHHTGCLRHAPLGPAQHSYMPMCSFGMRDAPLVGDALGGSLVAEERPVQQPRAQLQLLAVRHGTDGVGLGGRAVGAPGLALLALLGHRDVLVDLHDTDRGKTHSQYTSGFGCTRTTPQI